MDENVFQGLILRDDLPETDTRVRLKVFTQLESFTDDNGIPKRIPGFRGLHAILDEISDEETKELLSLNYACPHVILKMRVSLLIAETMQVSSIPARLESAITSCVLQIAGNYVKARNRQALNLEDTVDEDEDSVTDGGLVTFGSPEHEAVMSDTEACVFFTGWQHFWPKWHFGDIDPNENLFDGKIMVDGDVLEQLESFTDENGSPKRIPGFPGLYAILDEVANENTTLPFRRCPRCVEKTRMSLYLAEMMEASPLPTDRKTLARVKSSIFTLHPTFDWDKYFGSDYMHLQLVLRAIGSEHYLPREVLDSIASYLLPDKLKSAIANCVFQLAVKFHEKLKSGDDSEDDHTDSDSDNHTDSDDYTSDDTDDDTHADGMDHYLYGDTDDDDDDDDMGEDDA